MLESEAIMKRTARLLVLLVLFSTGSAQHVEPGPLLENSE